MGQVTSAIAAMRLQKIYLDTNVFIYFLEPHPVFFPVAAAFMNAVHAKTLQGYTGELAVAETLVAPYRANDSKLVADVKRFFRAKDFLSVLPHDAPIFDTAAQLRARNISNSSMRCMSPRRCGQAALFSSQMTTPSAPSTSSTLFSSATCCKAVSE